MNIDRKLRSRPARLLLALPVAALAFSLAACSGAAERPSTSELSAGINQIFEDGGIGGQFTDEQITCISELLLDSELSDQDLANIAEGNDVQTDQAAYDLMQDEMTTAAQECLTAE